MGFGIPVRNGLSVGLGSYATLSSGRATPWTPAKITTALWLDASDSATVVLNGSTVSQWNDKSGNGRNVAQSTASLQPGYSTTAWSATQAAISFDGIDDYLDAAASWTANDWSYYIVSQRTSGTPTSQTIVGNAGGSTFIPIALASGASNFNLFRIITNDPAAMSAYYSGTMIKDKNATPTVDRAQIFTRMGNKHILETLGTPSFASTLRLGTTGATTYKLTGMIAEVVVTPTDSTTAERQVIEGYLAWKWGGF